MTPEQLLKELEVLAGQCSIAVRYEKGDFEGGFCVLKAERLIVVNKKLAPAKKASILAQGLADIGIDEMYLKPVIREFIEDELARLRAETLLRAQVRPTLQTGQLKTANASLPNGKA